MRKILYLMDQPLDDRNYARFGIQTWIARGWDVEAWDLTAFVHPRAWQDFLDSGHMLAAFPGYVSIASSRELRQKFSRLGKVQYFVDLAGDSYWPTRARMRLVRSGATRVSCATGSIPGTTATGERGFAGKLTKALSEHSAGALFGRLINICMNRLAALFVGPGLYVAAGEKSISSGAQGNDILKAHNFDYDIYLKLQKECDAPAAPYGVFLDQDMCSHPEYIYAGVPLYATADKYFPAIRHGLDGIARALGTPMRIAAHPRLSRHSRYTDHFAGMEVEFGKTAELIGRCSFVVCHYTTAVQFAVLFKKPVIFVTTDELNASAAGGYIKSFAASLGRPVINLDGDLTKVDWREQLNIDSKKYEQYRRTYIKTDGSPEIPHWDIVIDHLEKSSGPMPVNKLERAGEIESYD